MLNMNLQFFAHKKGVGSTKNGRDSESKRFVDFFSGQLHQSKPCDIHKGTDCIIVLYIPFECFNKRIL